MIMELTRDLHIEDIKRALGLNNTRHAGNDLFGQISLFGAGLLVGAGLALLLAPMTGNELREKLHDQVDDLRGQVPEPRGEGTA
jgi:hypothetical protein